MTAAEVGEEAADLFGSGWTSTTPAGLLRGMYRNWMVDPDQQCELLASTENMVRVRCNRPYVEDFGSSGTLYGVSLEEFDANLMAFASRIAELRGMTWTQTMDGASSVITIRKP